MIRFDSNAVLPALAGAPPRRGGGPDLVLVAGCCDADLAAKTEMVIEIILNSALQY